MIKIIQDEKVIDVVRIPRYIKFLPTGHITITDKASAQGIVGSDTTTVYSFTPIADKAIGVASIVEIDQKEFDRLTALLKNKQEICADESTLAEAKRATLHRLSNMCKSKIVAGFSVRLSDGVEYSFKLTTEDQLNLLMLENQLSNGAETFIYHATNQPCRFFIKEDMIRIINAFKNCTLYHTTYFNVAKQYINSLTNIEDITKFTYGTDVSGIIEDKVLKQILKNGGDTQ